MSKLNCKPGDLVVVVRSTLNPQTIGFITTVVKYEANPRTGEHAWRVSPPLPGQPIYWEGAMRVTDWVVDRNLKPLRNPGEDARDETLDWLPLPVTTKDAEVSNG